MHLCIFDLRAFGPTIHKLAPLPASPRLISPQKQKSHKGERMPRAAFAQQTSRRGARGVKGVKMRWRGKKKKANWKDSVPWAK